MIKTASKHDSRTREMAIKPHIIGLDNIVLATAEGHIMKPSGELVGEPDNLFFDPTTKKLYQVEYKCRGGAKNADKAMYQLKRNGLILQAMFGDWEVIDLYVHDNFEVERIKY